MPMVRRKDKWARDREIQRAEEGYFGPSAFDFFISSANHPKPDRDWFS